MVEKFPLFLCSILPNKFSAGMEQLDMASSITNIVPTRTKMVRSDKVSQFH